MSAFITIFGAVSIGILSPAMFGAWYTVPAFALPVFLMLWHGTSDRTLIWGSVAAIAGELACGLSLGTIALPYIVFFALLYGAGYFISWRPFGGNEKWTLTNALTALIIIPAWHIFIFVSWMIKSIFTGGLVSDIGTRAMFWFNIHTLCWIVGIQIFFLVLCRLTERRRIISW